MASPPIEVAGERCPKAPWERQWLQRALARKTCVIINTIIINAIIIMSPTGWLFRIILMMVMMAMTMEKAMVVVIIVNIISVIASIIITIITVIAIVTTMLLRKMPCSCTE